MGLNFEHYLPVRTWSLELVAEVANFKRTLVRIRFPSLNMVYYDESVLLVTLSR